MLLRRSLSASFVGGAHVFPGGVVDEGDQVVTTVHGLDDAQASTLLGVDRQGLSFWVASVRETFEEAGVLLAIDRKTGEWPTPERMASQEMRAARRAVHDGLRDFSGFLEEQNLIIAAQHLLPWSRWVTPVGSPKRFDTRFFFAQGPPLHDPVHDESETIESAWWLAQDALDAFRRDQIQLIFPTVKSLESLTRYPTVRDVMLARRPNCYVE